MFYCVVTVCNVGYVCSFCGHQIFMDFVSFLSMIILYLQRLVLDIRISTCLTEFSKKCFSKH